MDTFGRVAYETAVAYVLPGGVAYFPFCLYLHLSKKLDFGAMVDPKQSWFVLLSLAVSAAFGVCINMFAHVLFNKWPLGRLPLCGRQGKSWKQLRKERCYLGKCGRRTYLRTLIERAYPDASEDTLTRLVDAIFMYSGPQKLDTKVGRNKVQYEP